MAVGVRPAKMALAAATRRRVTARRRIGRVLTYLGVALVVALFAIPMLWMIVSSLKTPDALSAPGITWIPRPV